MLSGGCRRAALVAAAVLQMKMGVIAVKQGFVEPAVQPAAPLAMQRCREEMPDTDYSGVLEENEKDEKASAVEHRRERRCIARVVKEGDRIDKFAGGLGHPHACLARRSREQREHDRQRPGFLPAFREPVGPHQTPEASHGGDRRQRRQCRLAAVPSAQETLPRSHDTRPNHDYPPHCPFFAMKVTRFGLFQINLSQHGAIGYPDP